MLLWWFRGQRVFRNHSGAWRDEDAAFLGAAAIAEEEARARRRDGNDMGDYFSRTLGL